MFQVHQHNFEGPLDLLLELTREKKLNLSEISLAQVADDYLSYIKSQNGRIEPAVLAEFLVIASQLMLMKSRALLPDVGLSAEEEESLEELEKRMHAYQKIKALAEHLFHLQKKDARIATRSCAEKFSARFCPPEGASQMTILAAYREFLYAHPAPLALETRTLGRVLSLDDVLLRIQARLETAFEHAFSTIAADARDRTEMIVSFLALLELMKERVINLEQERPFEEIMVRKVSQ